MNLLNNHLLPPPRGRHASCPEMRYSKRGTKFKKEKKNGKFPLHALQVVGSAYYNYYYGVNPAGSNQRYYIAGVSGDEEKQENMKK